MNAETISKKISANLIYIEFEGNIKKSGNYFLKLYRQKEIDSPEFIAVFQTETKRSGEGILRWKKIRIGAASLIKDDYNSNIKIQIFQFSRNGNHKKVGESSFVFKMFMDSRPNVIFDKDPSNFVRPASVIFEERFSFVDYLFNGLNISMIIAIDFTGSNLDPNLANSLHFYDPYKNQYMAAITSVGSILECYDTDKMFPTLGFGSRIQGFGQNTSHCFALNGNIFAPEVFGVKGILDIYRNNLMKLNFSGPTHFNLILNYAANMAEQYVKNGILNTFFVLLIITDGEIHDINETIDELVRCSGLPLSVIIVGVGNEDFRKMDILDADIHPLVSKRFGKMKNDIVQFVPLREFISNPQLLASETLKELPKQVSDYMKSINANPKKIINSVNSTNFNYQEMRKAECIGQYGSDNNLQKAISIGIPTLENEFMNFYSQPQFINPLIKY